MDSPSRAIPALVVALLVAVALAPAYTSAQQESSRTSPIAFGESAEVGDWAVRVVRVDFDAADDVLAENQFNDPPEPGHQFVLATLEMTYNGAETGNPNWGLSLKAVGESSVAYGQSDPGCGAVPNDMMDAPELFPGGSTVANACWSVPKRDVASLVMFVEPSFSFDDERAFLALSPEGADRSDVVAAAQPSRTSPIGRAPRITDSDKRPGGRGAPIPYGQSARVGDWTIRVLRVDFDATELVLAENQFNDPPEPGEAFVLVQVVGRYEGGGDDTANLWSSLSFKAVGDASVAYGQSDSDCGVVPDELYDQPEVFGGGSVMGNVCWSIPTEERNSIVMMVEPSFNLGDEPAVFFALRRG